MIKYSCISPNEFKVVPWRNGRGTTAELWVCQVPGKDIFAGRLSMASVVANGRFSDFSGYDRTLILIQGKGVVLTHGNGQRDELKKRFDMASFSGNCGTCATLIDGPIKDFNIMTHKETCSSEVNVLKDFGTHELPVDSDHLLIYAPDNDISILTDQNQRISLSAGHLLHVPEPIHATWSIKGNSIICTRISYNKTVLSG